MITFSMTELVKSSKVKDLIWIVLGIVIARSFHGMIYRVVSPFGGQVFLKFKALGSGYFGDYEYLFNGGDLITLGAGIVLWILASKRPKLQLLATGWMAYIIGFEVAELFVPVGA